MNSLKLKVSYAQSILRLTNILLSSLHFWGLDATLDKLFIEKLGFLKPKYPIAFGRISRGAHLFVMFPPKRATFSFTRTDTFSINENLNHFTTQNPESKMVTTKSFNLIDFGESEDDDSKKLVRQPSFSILPVKQSSLDTPSPTREYWLITKCITTEHLLSLLSISNSFMSLQNFIDLQSKRE